MDDEKRTPAELSPGPASERALHATAWLLVGALAFAMCFPVVLLRGMSLDGITYATIARNMAQGAGDLWHPFYTATLLNPFFEQPPLALWLESWFFRAFGDRWWVERLYSVLTAVPTAVALAMIWRALLAGDRKAQRLAWLPLLFWIAMPGWFWIYRHNYLENTLGIFTTWGVLAGLKAAQSAKAWSVWALLAGLAIAAALASKGPVGLFPLVTPAIAWLTLRPKSAIQATRVQASVVAVVAVLLALTLTYAPAREFVAAYYQHQVVTSLQGQRETVDSAWGRFDLVWQLVVHLLPTAIIAAALGVWGLRHAVAGPLPRGPLLFCLLSALSGSLPIMVSPKQTGYYTAPTWGLFAMALALACLPSVIAIVDRVSQIPSIQLPLRRVQIGVGLALALLVAMSPAWYGRTQRDAQLIRDVQRIGQLVGKRQTIIIPSTMSDEWSLQAYLYRWHYISVHEADECEAYRLQRADEPQDLSAEWILADTQLREFRLYKRRELAAADDIRQRR